jgi:long-chain fatty acid transport protein
MNKKQIIRAASAAILALPVTAFATNGYQLIGVGAYQKSLGGAVTANPGSAMTAVANPAGAARVGNRADFSMEAFMPRRDVDFTALGGASSTSAVDMYGVPAIGWTAPVDDGSNVYFGGGMYGTSGMGVDYAQGSMMPGMNMNWDGYSNISFWQMAPTVAWNHSDGLSFGVSLNIDYQAASFKQRVMNSSTNAIISNFDLSRGASGFGYGLSLGVLYDVNDRVTVGASYKSKQDFAPLKYQLATGDITDATFGAMPGGTYTLDLDFPQQAALGVKWRATDALTVSADAKWINWSDTMDKLTVKGAVNVPMDPGWNDQTVYAVGLAYAVSQRMNLRAGYNYAAAPFGAEQVSHNLILPALTETHYTVGMDYNLNKRWQLGMHYMYAPKVTLAAPATDPMAPGAKISLSETSFGANIGYRF